MCKLVDNIAAVDLKKRNEFIVDAIRESLLQHGSAALDPEGILLLKKILDKLK